MLVLNSNTDTGGNALTNQNVMINYPDIENSILLFPDRFNNTNGKLATINGIDIHMLGGELSKDNMMNVVKPLIPSSNELYPPVVGCCGPNPSNITTPLTIDNLVGQVIGKKIVLPDFLSSNGTPSIKVGILHADGTITFFQDQYIYYNYIYDIQPFKYNNSGTSTGTNNAWGIWSSGSSGNHYHCYIYAPQTKILETQGIVVQEGDRPFAQIGKTANASLSFGSFIPTSQEFRIKPIQISID